MNKKSLLIIILVLVTAIVTLILADFLGNKPDKRGENPYEYNVDEYKSVNKNLIHYRETRNIPIGERTARALCVSDGIIYIAGDDFLQAVKTDGTQLLYLPLKGRPECIHTTQDHIMVGFEKSISLFNHQGNVVSQWEIPESKTVITSIASKGNTVYVADAGNRRVIRYSLKGERLGQFEGKRESNAGHGFIVPSANFDIKINSFGELWVVNPGVHALENYTDEGQLRGYWAKSSMNIDGFTGCCNPAEISIQDDGSFVTSEKGLVRIKVYNASGELRSVVAGPDKFEEEGKAPEVDVDSEGVIYALDFDKNTIRIFEKKKG